MSFRVLAARLAKRPLFEASIKVPPTVDVTKAADQLIFAGPLGASRLGLSSIDSLGDGALKLVPEAREIAVCSTSKAFFGTLQVSRNPLPICTARSKKQRHLPFQQCHGMPEGAVSGINS